MGDNMHGNAVDLNAAKEDWNRKLERSEAASIVKLVISPEEMARRAQILADHAETEQAKRAAYGKKVETIVVPQAFVKFRASEAVKASNPEASNPNGVQVTRIEKRTRKGSSDKAPKAEKAPKVSYIFDGKELAPGMMRQITISDSISLHTRVVDSHGHQGVVIAFREGNEGERLLPIDIRYNPYHTSEGLGSSQIVRVLWDTPVNGSSETWVSSLNLKIPFTACEPGHCEAEITDDTSGFRIGRHSAGDTGNRVQFQIGNYKIACKPLKDEDKQIVLVAHPPAQWEVHCWRNDNEVILDVPQGHEKSFRFWESEIGEALKRGTITSAKMVVPEVHHSKRPKGMMPGEVYVFTASLKSTIQVGTNGMILSRDSWIGEKGQVKGDKFVSHKAGTQISKEASTLQTAGEWQNIREEKKNFSLTVHYQGGHDPEVIYTSSGTSAVRQAFKLMTEGNRGVAGFKSANYGWLIGRNEGWVVSMVKVVQINEDSKAMIDPVTGKESAILTFDGNKIARLQAGSFTGGTASPLNGEEYKGETLDCGKIVKPLAVDPIKDPRGKQFMSGSPGRTGITFTRTSEQEAEDKARRSIQTIQNRVWRKDLSEKLAIQKKADQKRIKEVRHECGFDRA